MSYRLQIQRDVSADFDGKEMEKFNAFLVFQINLFIHSFIQDLTVFCQAPYFS